MSNVEMTFVWSSDVESIGYDDSAEELYVTYIKGGTYIYSGVPRVIYDEFLNAPSKGQFVKQQVKDAGFPYRRA